MSKSYVTLATLIVKHMSRMNTLSRITHARALAVVMIGLAMSLVAPAFAQQGAELQSYDVELILIRHLSANHTEESWGLESSVGEKVAIPEEDASPFETPPVAQTNTAVQSFPALPSSKLKLTALVDSLRRSRNYQPIAHIGWTQPGYVRNAAPFMPINNFVPGSSGISGQVALSRGRYLHLTLDLSYDAPATATEPAQRYVLRQSRRMRSNERHYIDHPRFGVIALITPSGK